MAAIEFAFTGPGRLHRGELVRFANHGYLVHMITGIRAKNLADVRELAKLPKEGKINQASKLATGFVSFLNPRRTAHCSKRRFRLGAATGSSRASWRHRLAATTPSSAWGASSISWNEQLQD